MNRRILQLALPNIITNITVPLLGMVDMAIVGHLSQSHIGAIAIGTSMFNLIYWNFGFLRMGTSGFTAQAYGARRLDEAVATLVRAFTIALAIAALLIALQWPLAMATRLAFNGSDEVMTLALSYFFVRIWAAPATLGLYAIKGWMIGMQNSKLPMWIAIALNVVNIVCSLLFVLVLHWGIKGVALGTVVAQYSGLAMGLWLLHRYYGRVIRGHLNIAGSLRLDAMRHFFHVNGDIFLRTVCLALVFAFITAASGRIGDDILAVDALLLQFFTVFSYIMDGFAYAGESLVGRYIGAADGKSLRRTIRLLMLWGVALTVTFTIAYALGGSAFLGLFSDKPEVSAAAKPYLFWTLITPVCGFAAFLFDGIFIGATASRHMRDSMFVATAVFFAVYYGLRALLGLYDNPDAYLWNNVLWTAFMAYLVFRGAMQALMLNRAVYSKAPQAASTLCNLKIAK
ncbi:MAG: MATE family efflux transporter [Bacteroidales bacterium]|nr:MATE family efflux transporter [Bacteroidales bacterium]